MSDKPKSVFGVRDRVARAQAHFDELEKEIPGLQGNPVFEVGRRYLYMAMTDQESLIPSLPKAVIEGYNQRQHKICVLINDVCAFCGSDE